MPVELVVPSVGESITQVEIGDWLKTPGEAVAQDEPVVVIETEKVTVELPAPANGTITQMLKKKGDKAAVGDVIGYMEPNGTSFSGKDRRAGPAEREPDSAKPKEEEREPDAKRQRDRAQPQEMAKPKEKEREPERLKPAEPSQVASSKSLDSKAPPSIAKPSTGREEQIVPMTPIRRRIAERLVEAQKTAALLTTFNQVDMSAVMTLRKEYQESFRTKYQIKLGFMSFFVKASIESLKLVPQLNAEIRGHDIVFHNYYDIGIAVGGAKGLVVPVLRNAERLSFAEIERAIADYAERAQANQLKVDELQGGTFTISNGGVYGSMLSTPIVNPPQSGVLGLHSIEDQPVARDGAVVIRPMMYVALTYDHRIVDGREAVTFLRHVKDLIENPARMLLEI
jgi:2-oxoglutarate dehydrogenase E2 component (dihydrolipoamide succinyltransferase)